MISRRTPVVAWRPSTLQVQCLRRCLRGTSYIMLVRAVCRWRVSVVQSLRHQALQRLRQASVTQQHSLAALRKSIPRLAQRGTAPLAQLARTSRLLWLCRAIGRWRASAATLAVEYGRPLQSAGTVDGTNATRARTKRAGAQEIALMDLRTECTTLRVAAAERERQLALAQKQLAHEVDR